MTTTYAFLSSNERKSAEYKAQLAKYGRAICILPCPDEPAEQLLQTAAYLQRAQESDRYVLRERSNLFVAADWDEGLPTISSKSINGERVYNLSILDVYYLDPAGALQTSTYQAKIEGSLDLTLRQTGTDSDWWDDIFVAQRSQASYQQERDLWGKTSARQQTIGLFICDHVVFKQLKDVSFKPHRPAQSVDFTVEHAGLILRNNPFVKLARLEQSAWGLGNLLTQAVNQGIFFRSADSRRSGNYFCPPLSGIPRIQKPDPFWETTFQIHDFFHQLLPDQIFTGKSSEKHKNVYVAARLMSEALTIVLADMLFVEEVKKAGFEYDYSARKINPLFASLTLTGQADEQLKTLLQANVALANLGDHSLYLAILKPGCEQVFRDYADTYTHFFVPDLIWSAENFDDMLQRRDQFAAWTELLGKDLFKRACLPLLDDLVQHLEASGADLSSYTACVYPVFDYLFQTVIAAGIKPIEPLTDEKAQSHAFLRYMIGQTFMYSTYRHVPGIWERGKQMLTKLRAMPLFTQKAREEIRSQYARDLAHLKSLQIITADDCSLYEQIFPLFSPHFLSYDFDKAVYQSIPEAIEAAFKNEQYGSAKTDLNLLPA